MDKDAQHARESGEQVVGGVSRLQGVVLPHDVVPEPLEEDVLAGALVPRDDDGDLQGQ